MARCHSLVTYKEVGEEQRTDKDGNKLYLDEYGERTTEVTEQPCMKSVYDEVMQDVDSLDERDRARYEAIQKIKEAILALA